MRRQRKVTDTAAGTYTARLVSLESVWWKRLLNVNAPYQWNLRRLGLGRTLDVGCGIGRNLATLPPGSVGVDHNASSVAIARERGLSAVTTSEFLSDASAHERPFDALLFAHILEHVDEATARTLVAGYLPHLSAQGRLVLITPQEAGYRSDSSHVHFMDFTALRDLVASLGLEVVREYSFPFPRGVGHLFKYNEFVLIARRAPA